MKKILFLLLLLPVFGWAQPCADEDTVRSNAVSLITATTARINGSVSHFSGSYVTLYLKYVRSGLTDTVTVSGVTPLRNLTGLQPSTIYRYYYMTSCASGSEYQLGSYSFTTLSSSVAYVYERPTYFNYWRADSGMTVPRVDTALYRSPNTSGGDIVFKTSDSKFYGYNGSYWQWLGVDSAGIITSLNLKVDSVTVSGDSLFYWVNGTGYGYILPANDNDWQLDGNSSTAGTDFLGTTNNTSLRFRTNNTAVAVLDSNGRFGIGTNSPLYPLDIYKSANTDVLFRIKNDNAGAGASSYLNLDNGTSSGGMFHTGTGYTTVDYLLPNQTSYGGGGAGGVALVAGAGAAMKFVQVQSEIARFSSTGIFGVGTTTPDSLITSHLGLHAKRGVRFSGLLDFADTTDWKPVVANSSGTLRKATYWPGGGGGWGTSGTVATLTGAAELDQATFDFAHLNGSVGIGISTPDASALLDITSTTKGILIPRMTEAERDAMGVVTQSMLIFNTTSGKFNYYDGAAWSSIGDGIYAGNGTMVSDATATMGGKILLVNDATAGDFLELNPVAFRSLIQSSDGTNLTRLRLNADAGNTTDFLLQADDGVTPVQIFGSVDNNEMTYTAGTHILNGDVDITGTTHDIIGDVNVTGATTFTGYVKMDNTVRVTSQFDMTSDVTLTDVTELTKNVVAGKTYMFKAELFTTSNASGGVKFAIGGTATATSIIYQSFDNIGVGGRGTALGTAVSGLTTATAATALISGTITVNAGGTLTAQFAQNASFGTASSVLVGSTFTVTEIN